MIDAKITKQVRDCLRTLGAAARHELACAETLKGAHPSHLKKRQRAAHRLMMAEDLVQAALNTLKG